MNLHDMWTKYKIDCVEQPCTISQVIDAKNAFYSGAAACMELLGVASEDIDNQIDEYQKDTSNYLRILRTLAEAPSYEEMYKIAYENFKPYDNLDSYLLVEILPYFVPDTTYINTYSLDLVKKWSDGSAGPEEFGRPREGISEELAINHMARILANSMLKEKFKNLAVAFLHMLWFRTDKTH